MIKTKSSTRKIDMQDTYILQALFLKNCDISLFLWRSTSDVSFEYVEAGFQNYSYLMALSLSFQPISGRHLDGQSENAHLHAFWNPISVNRWVSFKDVLWKMCCWYRKVWIMPYLVPLLISPSVAYLKDAEPRFNKLLWPTVFKQNVW